MVNATSSSSSSSAPQGRFLSYVILAIMVLLANVATAEEETFGTGEDAATVTTAEEEVFGTADDDYYICVCDGVNYCKQMVAIQCADTCYEDATNGNHSYDVQCLENFMDDASHFMCGITLLEYDQIFNDLSEAQTCL